MEVDPKDRRYLAEINVVPLVDVVLVLLIIFMITAPLLYRGIDIQLPASDSNTITPDERLVVTVEKNGNIFLNKEKVLADNLEGAFAAARDRNPKVSVYLRADQAVPYGLVVRVMDAAKQAGLARLGMVTEPLKTR